MPLLQYLNRWLLLNPSWYTAFTCKCRWFLLDPIYHDV
jgi:hypothetical protein